MYPCVIRLWRKEKQRQMAFKNFQSLRTFRFLSIIFFLLEFFHICEGRFLLLYDDTAVSWNTAFGNGLSEYQRVTGKKIDYRAVMYKNESQWEEVCQTVSSDGVTAVVDLTKKMGDPESQAQKFFISKSIPYFRIQVPLDVLIKGVDLMLQSKNASNGFLIFPGELEVNRGVHVMLSTTLIRYAFLNAAQQESLIIEKFDYRVPSAVIMFGSVQQFANFIAKNYFVVRNRTEWIFMFDSFQETKPENRLNVSFPYIRGYFEGSFCCQLQNSDNKQSCDATNCLGNPTELFLQRLGYIFSDVLTEVDSAGTKIMKLSCLPNDVSKGENGFTQTFSDALNKKAEGIFEVKDRLLSLLVPLKFDELINETATPIGDYTSQSGFTQSSSYKFRERRRYFRIGIVDYKPWTFKDENGKWTGYCIDLAQGISEKMKFDYDLIESNGFGKRQEPNGRWDGLTGDLVHGKIDIAVAAYIMTSEREEFIDFVSPYYEQSGLIITMKRPVVKNSLFKFMTVLRTEVWLSIAGATVATGFMLWFLDKFSPYSAQNNPHKYKNFRKFTLKESFWFALTSFTPQGGGEPPKAFSGRTLVAAYWIFVVLMLATFTANLAAFLTVERMQSPIRNLEHLAAQSSVKYSVVNTSTAMTFFRNMAHAEETLYQMWRNLTLKAPSSAREYVVWEYPIREQYIHIHSVIKKTGTVENQTEGFGKAMEDDYYAFIHDAAQTRYEVYRNCNLTLIGEPFAEAPYAIAVAQGNPIQDDISMAILQLQTARFFESLSARYWTTQCPNLGEGESDGISLESLGGVFIATIIGLGIAFISLAIEVFTTARNRKKAKIEADNMIKPKFIGPMDFYGASKGNTQTQKSDVFRRAQFLPEVIN